MEEVEAMVEEGQYIDPKETLKVLNIRKEVLEEEVITGVEALALVGGEEATAKGEATPTLLL